MKKTIGMLVIIAALPLTAQTRTVDKDRYAEPQATATATRALAQLAEIARVAPRSGGLSPEEASRAQLLAPMMLAFVDLEPLRNYTAGTDPRTLLRDTGSRLYPVAVDSDVRSSITVSPAGGTWKATELGRPLLAKSAEAVRAATGASILVRVPALNATFLASDDGGTLRLTPLHDLPGTNFRRGATQNAEAVFTALVPLAQAHNGEPT